jgi:hypothetical protein
MFQPTPAPASASSKNLHGFADGDAFARYLREATSKVYGALSRQLLTRLVAEWNADPAAIRDEVRQTREDFVRTYVPADAGGQVRSVAARFALAIAIVNLAIRWDILDWPPGEPMCGIGVCFSAWLEQRGTTGAGEVEAGIAHVIQFIEAHGNSRFEPITSASRGNADGSASDHRVVNRVGFRQCDLDGHLQYFVLSQSWTGEVCKGHDAKLIARTLHERGHLQVDLARTKGKFSDMKRFPGHGSVRGYP